MNTLLTKKPEVLVGIGLACGLVFLNTTYEIPGTKPVLAREKTGYVPAELQESDSKKKLVRRSSWGTENPRIYRFDV